MNGKPQYSTLSRCPVLLDHYSWPRPSSVPPAACSTCSRAATRSMRSAAACRPPGVCCMAVAPRASARPPRPSTRPSSTSPAASPPSAWPRRCGATGTAGCASTARRPPARPSSPTYWPTRWIGSWWSRRPPTSSLRSQADPRQQPPGTRTCPQPATDRARFHRTRPLPLRPKRIILETAVGRFVQS